MTLRIIAGTFKGRLLKTPQNPSTRPTQGMLRGAVFNICQHQIEGAQFLDLFAGSGAMGFEALSRGASHVTFVEKRQTAILCIQQNIASLQVASQTTLLPTDASRALKKEKTPFDIIYIDPPYETPLAPLLEIILERHLLKPEGTLFVEERYHPKYTTSPLLFLKSTRRFGMTHLHEYTLLRGS